MFLHISVRNITIIVYNITILYIILFLQYQYKTFRAHVTLFSIPAQANVRRSAPYPPYHRFLFLPSITHLLFANRFLYLPGRFSRSPVTSLTTRTQCERCTRPYSTQNSCVFLLRVILYTCQDVFSSHSRCNSPYLPKRASFIYVSPYVPMTTVSTTLSFLLPNHPIAGQTRRETRFKNTEFRFEPRQNLLK